VDGRACACTLCLGGHLKYYINWREICLISGESHFREKFRRENAHFWHSKKGGFFRYFWPFLGYFVETEKYPLQKRKNNYADISKHFLLKNVF